MVPDSPEAVPTPWGDGVIALADAPRTADNAPIFCMAQHLATDRTGAKAASPIKAVKAPPAHLQEKALPGKARPPMPSRAPPGQAQPNAKAVPNLHATVPTVPPLQAAKAPPIMHGKAPPLQLQQAEAPPQKSIPKAPPAQLLEVHGIPKAPPTQLELHGIPKAPPAELELHGIPKAPPAQLVMHGIQARPDDLDFASEASGERTVLQANAAPQYVTQIRLDALVGKAVPTGPPRATGSDSITNAVNRVVARNIGQEGDGGTFFKINPIDPEFAPDPSCEVQHMLNGAVVAVTTMRDGEARAPDEHVAWPPYADVQAAVALQRTSAPKATVHVPVDLPVASVPTVHAPVDPVASVPPSVPTFHMADGDSEQAEFGDWSTEDAMEIPSASRSPMDLHIAAEARASGVNKIPLAVQDPMHATATPDENSMPATPDEPAAQAAPAQPAAAPGNDMVWHWFTRPLREPSTTTVGAIAQAAANAAQAVTVSFSSGVAAAAADGLLWPEPQPQTAADELPEQEHPPQQQQQQQQQQQEQQASPQAFASRLLAVVESVADDAEHLDGGAACVCYYPRMRPRRQQFQ